MLKLLTNNVPFEQEFLENHPDVIDIRMKNPPVYINLMGGDQKIVIDSFLKTYDVMHQDESENDRENEKMVLKNAIQVVKQMQDYTRTLSISKNGIYPGKYANPIGSLYTIVANLGGFSGKMLMDDFKNESIFPMSPQKQSLISFFEHYYRTGNDLFDLTLHGGLQTDFFWLNRATGKNYPVFYPFFDKNPIFDVAILHYSADTIATVFSDMSYESQYLMNIVRYQISGYIQR